MINMDDITSESEFFNRGEALMVRGFRIYPHTFQNTLREGVGIYSVERRLARLDGNDRIAAKFNQPWPLAIYRPYLNDAAADGK